MLMIKSYITVNSISEYQQLKKTCFRSKFQGFTFFLSKSFKNALFVDIVDINVSQCYQIVILDSAITIINFKATGMPKTVCTSWIKIDCNFMGFQTRNLKFYLHLPTPATFISGLQVIWYYLLFCFSIYLFPSEANLFIQVLYLMAMISSYSNTVFFLMDQMHLYFNWSTLFVH